MPTGQEIMVRAGVLLQDTDHTRWPLSELCDWINEGVEAIVLAKPSAHSSTQVLELVEGTLQAIPSTALALLRVVRNLTDDSPRVGGRIVTPVNRATLDAQNPLWHDKRYVPFRREVRHVIFEEENPREFYVYPGNDGNGMLEAVLSDLPDPLAATGDATDIDSYAAEIGLPEPYTVPLVDYVCFRAQSKDDIAALPGRAMAHYTAFATAIGLKVQVEAATGPNAARVK